MHNGDNAKLEILSFLPQRQSIEPNFMTDTISFFIHTIYNGNNANFGVFTFKLHRKTTP